MDSPYSPSKWLGSRCWMITPLPDLLIQAETLNAPRPTISSEAGRATYELLPLNWNACPAIPVANDTFCRLPALVLAESKALPSPRSQAISPAVEASGEAAAALSPASIAVLVGWRAKVGVGPPLLASDRSAAPVPVGTSTEAGTPDVVVAKTWPPKSAPELEISLLPTLLAKRSLKSVRVAPAALWIPAPAMVPAGIAAAEPPTIVELEMAAL